MMVLMFTVCYYVCGVTLYDIRSVVHMERDRSASWFTWMVLIKHIVGGFCQASIK